VVSIPRSVSRDSKLLFCDLGLDLGQKFHEGIHWFVSEILVLIGVGQKVRL